MHKQEDHHHTPDQVRGYLQVAQRICEGEDLDEETTRAVLPVLVQLLSSKQVFYQQPAALPAMAIPRNLRQ
jgi:hypothetical protein